VATLTLTLADHDALRALFDEHLSKGRAFVPGDSEVGERERCELVLEWDGRTHRLVAEVVHIRREDPGRGVGLQLAPLDTAGAEELRGFVECAAAPQEETAIPEDQPEPEQESEEGEESHRAHNLQERLSGLTGPEQLRLAAAGTLQERVGLERMYGPGVWETLLRNNRVTPPEVARIARKGTLPRPLVELIASNKGWLAVGEVQRALLSNPRSSLAVVQKVLRLMSKPDLQLVPQQTAYPPTVRQAAKNMLGRF
jgi:hypothetical protein